MQYAIKFYQGCRVLDKANEIIIKYNHNTTELVDFVQKWREEQRIVVNITELAEDQLGDFITIFKASIDQHPRMTILTSLIQNYEQLVENELPFFFYEGVSCYDDLYAQVSLGVTDVYIMNEMGFNLEKIADYCHKYRNNHVNIRVFPNVAQTKSQIYNDKIQRFFIRPEGIEVYEPYVDICEFYGPLDRQSVLYEIYSKAQWLGNLHDLILDLGTDVDNTTIMPYFDVMRITCNKRCLFGKCDICTSIKNFGQVLADNDLRIVKRKNNEFRSNEEFMQNESAETIENYV